MRLGWGWGLSEAARAVGGQEKEWTLGQTGQFSRDHEEGLDFLGGDFAYEKVKPLSGQRHCPGAGLGRHRLLEISLQVPSIDLRPLLFHSFFSSPDISHRRARQ